MSIENPIDTVKNVRTACGKKLMEVDNYVHSLCNLFESYENMLNTYKKENESLKKICRILLNRVDQIRLSREEESIIAELIYRNKLNPFKKYENNII